MIQPHLRKLRILVSGLFLVLMAWSFLDLYGHVMPGFIRGLLFFQLMPALMKTLAQGGAALFSLLAVIGLTILAGRIYCSFLCPLGTLMDLVIRFSSAKRPFASLAPYSGLRYGILGLTLVTVAAGSLALVNMLDPFSLFGRLMTVLIRPLVISVNNLLARMLESFGFYALVTVEWSLAVFSVLLICLVVTCALAGLAMKRGRLYCNTLCPVGTFLGLVSRFSLFRVIIDRNTCVRCGKCRRVCKAGCIDAELTVDVSRCVSCFDCLNLCPENSISLTMGRRGKAKPTATTDPDRRTLVVLLTLALVGFPRKLMAQVARPFVFVKNTIPVKRQHPITPPGSRSIDAFTRACTGCYLCVSHCPGTVIQPGLADYGARGVMMPRMDNSKGFCNFTCTTCGEVCPSGAILPLPLEEKQGVQIGVVHFIRENCIVITQKTECGACSEHCPTKAVFMVVEGGLRVPQVNPTICLGCGACEYACPSIPHKSIYVDGNPIHLTADKPKIETLEYTDPNKDFPF